MENLFEYRREMDVMRFTPEQKARLASQAASAAAGEKHSARRPARRRVAVAAVAAAAVLAVGGGAAAAGLVGNFFTPVFGSAQTRVIDKIGRPIGAAVTDGGVTVTAEAVVGDKYNACVVFTVKRADGSPLGLPAGVPLSNLSFEQAPCLLGVSGHGTSWFTKSESGGNAVQYVEEISTESHPLNGKRLCADFRNLRYFNQSTGKAVTLCKGEWKLKFRADYEDSSVALPAGETFSQNGIRFQVTGISVSSVAMHIEYETDSMADLNESPKDGRKPSAANTEKRYLDSISVVLTKKDGSRLNLTNWGGGISCSGGKTVCVKSGVLREIVPLEEMKSVSVGGTVIPVPAS